jgi:hypothetical protein
VIPGGISFSSFSFLSFSSPHSTSSSISPHIYSSPISILTCRLLRSIDDDGDGGRQRIANCRQLIAAKAAAAATTTTTANPQTLTLI